MTRCGERFIVRSVPAEELHGGAPPEELLKVNAARKADAAAAVSGDADVVIGADTGIVFGNELIGKPRDLEDAKQILRKLSGRVHEVCTAVSLRGAFHDDFLAETRVFFKPLSEQVIGEYLSKVSVLDKAGAYALQEHGEMLIDKIEGDADNVVGLPCRELLTRLGRRHVAASLFFSFAKITLLVVGGGYVILSAVEMEFVRRRKWISDKEFADISAIAQTIPGLIAPNAAVALGFKMRGIWGALAALAGAALPPAAVIMVIASFAVRLPSDIPWLNGVFTGISGGIAGLIAATAWNLGKKTFCRMFPAFLALGAFAGVVFLRWNPGLVMLGAIPLGIAGVFMQSFSAVRGGKA